MPTGADLPGGTPAGDTLTRLYPYGTFIEMRATFNIDDDFLRRAAKLTDTKDKDCLGHVPFPVAAQRGGTRSRGAIVVASGPLVVAGYKSFHPG